MSPIILVVVESTYALDYGLKREAHDVAIFSQRGVYKSDAEDFPDPRYTNNR